MCCGKMVRLPNERGKIILSTGNINVNLEKKKNEKGIGSRSWRIHRKLSS